MSDLSSLPRPPKDVPHYRGGTPLGFILFVATIAGWLPLGVLAAVWMLVTR